MLRAPLLQKASALIRQGPALIHRRPAFAAPPSLSLSLSLLHRSYTTTPKHIRKRQKKAEEAARPPAYAQSLLQLRTALDNEDVQGIASSYNGIRSLLPLGAKDVDQMARSVHLDLRKLSSAVKESRLPPNLVNFADILVADIQAKVLPPSYTAHIHLLAFFKESAQYDKGKAFWSWLVRQDDSYVNAKLYGAAIELLAFQGSPAEETESLYLDALRRFPANFTEYHLSPDAVVSDRTQQTNIKGIPMVLFQGILTARILRGETALAYLTLDTALRLYPNQTPSRFFTLFVQERPLHEAYKVYHLACRTGTTLGQDTLKMLLTKMRMAAVARPIANAAILRAMLTSCFACSASGGTLNSNHLNEIVIALTSLLKSDHVTHMSAEQLRPITDGLLELKDKLLSIWTERNSRPGIATFNTLIANLAGRGKRYDIIMSTLAEMRSHGIQPNAVTRRSLVSAAGDIGDKDLLHAAWTELVAQRISAGAALDLPDWQNLLNAAKKTDDREYLLQQLTNFKHIISPQIFSRITWLLDSEVPETPSDKTDSHASEDILRIINLLQHDLDYFAENTHTMRNFHDEPIPLSLQDSELYRGASPEDIRTVYDEMTTDPSAPPPPEPLPEHEHDTEVDAVAADEEADKHITQPRGPALSLTQIPLDELRYENWKAVNELLYDAERYDTEYMDAVDAAIKAGQNPPKRDTTWNVPNAEDVVGLSDLKDVGMSTSSEETANVEQRSLEEIRQEVFRLRGRLA